MFKKKKECYPTIRALIKLNTHHCSLKLTTVVLNSCPKATAPVVVTGHGASAQRPPFQLVCIPDLCRIPQRPSHSSHCPGCPLHRRSRRPVSAGDAEAQQQDERGRLAAVRLQPHRRPAQPRRQAHRHGRLLRAHRPEGPAAHVSGAGVD